MRPTSVGMVGHTGLVGSGIAASLRDAGHDVVDLHVARAFRTYSLQSLSLEWIQDQLDHDPVLEVIRRNLEGQMRGLEFVVNAAGRATPGARAATADLWCSNTLLPALVVQAAAAAGVRRVVHISSAVACSAHRPLAEDPAHVGQRLSTPYATSKSFGEHLFLDAARRSGLSAVVQRPTSLVHPSRPMMKGFVRGLRLGLIPDRTRGGAPVRVALCTRESLSRLTTLLLHRDDAPAVVNQPDGELAMADCYEAVDARPGPMSVVARETWPRIRSIVHDSKWRHWGRRLDPIVLGEWVESSLLPDEQERSSLSRDELRVALLRVAA